MLSHLLEYYELARHQLDEVKGQVLPESLFNVFVLVHLSLKKGAIDLDEAGKVILVSVKVR
jgi:hypothetical protein